MSPLIIRQRWTPWWIAIPMLAVYAAGGWLLFANLGQPNSGVRIAIPPFLLLGVLVLPAVLNARVITAGTHGVTVRNRPLPKGRNVDVAREDIRFCNVRVQYSNFESDSGSAAIANYLVGVDTKYGQIDIAYPYLKVKDAQAVAERIAAGLNQNRLLREIPLAAATRSPDQDARWRRRVLSWGGMFILAIVLGAVWELY